MTSQWPPQPQRRGNQPPHPDPHATYAHHPTASYLPRKRRRVWPWVLLTVVLVPIIVLVSCTALVGGAVKSIDDSRKGGTVKIGDTFTYKSGLALNVATPTPYDAKNQFTVGQGEVAYESIVTITNGTGKPVAATLITMNATLAGSPAQRVLDEATFPTQDIAPGQSLKVPFRFKTKAGQRGPLQIAVTDTFNEPVFFTATIG